MSDDALAALAIGLGLLVPFGLVAWWLMLRFRRREMQHKAWMAALEKGVPMPALDALEMGMAGTRTYLLRGLIWLACGITLSVFLLGMWLTTGPRLSFPLGLSLVGLVPAGVGVAYLVFYRAETRRALKEQ